MRVRARDGIELPDSEIVSVTEPRAWLPSKRVLRALEMRYFLAIVLPPLAVLLCGKPIQFILNIFLTLLFWIPGVIHAILVVHSHLADKRTEKIVRERAVRGGN